MIPNFPVISANVVDRFGRRKCFMLGSLGLVIINALVSFLSFRLENRSLIFLLVAGWWAFPSLYRQTIYCNVNSSWGCAHAVPFQLMVSLGIQVQVDGFKLTHTDIAQLRCNLGHFSVSDTDRNIPVRDASSGKWVWK